MRDILKSSATVLGFAVLSISKVFAGGFTSGKGVYDFTAEYMGKYTDESLGASKKKYNSGIEINNDFGITENQTVAFDIFIDRSAGGEQSQSFQTRHRMNFKYSDSVNFGLQNSLGFFDNTNGTYSMRWALRGMVRHDTKSGFYKHSRLEIEHRRWFNGALNGVRIDLRTKFRVADGVDFFIRLNTYLALASKDYFESKDVDFEGVTQYSLKGLKINNSEIYAGPEFKLKNNDMVYIHAYSQLHSAPKKRSHGKGFLIGYSKSFNL
jgi:hypothetical protein